MRQWTGTPRIKQWFIVRFQIDRQEQNSVKSKSKLKRFRSVNSIWKCCLQNGGHLILGLSKMIIP